MKEIENRDEKHVKGLFGKDPQKTVNEHTNEIFKFIIDLIDQKYDKVSETDKGLILLTLFRAFRNLMHSVSVDMTGRNLDMLMYSDGKMKDEGTQEEPKQETKKVSKIITP